MARPKSPVRLDWVDPAVCSLEYRQKLVRGLPFFRHLPAQSFPKINAFFHDRDVAAGERVYYEGDAARYLYLVATGKVRLVRDTASGREVLLDILHGGEYFGALTVFDRQTYTETAIAQTDCCILRISADDFRTILDDHPEVTQTVLQVVGRRLAESQEIVKQLSAYNIEQRIAAALLRLAGKLGEARGQGVLIQVPFSRQDLAAMTGTTTETVSRVMSRLTGAGVVKSGRKWVTILDVERLAHVVESGAVN